MTFYAVAVGKCVGVFKTWSECQAQVSGFKGAVYKKFSSENEALEFIQKHGKISSCISPTETFEQHELESEEPLTNLVNNVASFPSHLASSASRIQNSASQFDVQVEIDTVKRDVNLLKSKLVPTISATLTSLFDDIGSRLDRVSKFLENQSSKREEETSSLNERPAKRKRPAIERIQLKEGIKVKTAINDNGFQVDPNGFVHVYTDGACSDNGRGSLSKAGIGVWWADNHPKNLAEPVQGNKATNNSAEIQAAIRAIETALENSIDKLWIQTDSMFLINCMTKWISGWKRNGWKTSNGQPVINKDDLVRLDDLLNDNKNLIVRWGHVNGHRGIHGNEAADELARAGAVMYSRKQGSMSN